MRALALSLALLFAFTSLHAADEAVIWGTSLDAGLVRAVAERKLVLLELRANCASCNRSLDDQLHAVEANEVVRHRYTRYVLVRVDSPSNERSVQALAKKTKPPALLVLDQTGELITSPTNISDVAYWTDFLSQIEGQSESIVSAAELRKQGKQGLADVTLGAAMLRLRGMDRARGLFDRAADEYKKGGDAANAQFARLYSFYAQYFLQTSRADQDMILSRMMRESSEAVSPTIAANGYLAVGSIHQIEHDDRSARSSFRRAFELAPPGSDAQRAAIQSLQALGETVSVKEAASAAEEPTIRIIAPPRATVTGRAEFVARTRPDIKRVAFFLDDVAAASVETPPFRARLDLGSVPRLSTIKAVAYDARGAAVGQATTTVNDRAETFRAQIVSPATDNISGAVDIEADAQPPAGHAIKSVELFWNEARLGNFTAPPFRVAFEAPSTFGYIRAVVTLDDGRTAEDTRVYNSGVGFAASVDVHAVSFSATILGSDGKRINGLSAHDILVRDEGNVVPVTVRGEDESSLVGLVIDASSSMRGSLLDMVGMAGRLIDLTTSPRDRMFLMSFDSEPHLIHPASSDAASLHASLLDVRADGATALVDAIAFALQQFTGIPGKKAVVVITDGIENDSGQSATMLTRMARESGIPIYVIIPQTGLLTKAASVSSPVESTNMSTGRFRRSMSHDMGHGQRFGNTLQGAADATGGAIFFEPAAAELESIFTRIRDEVRGQYILSFTADDRGKAGTWRKVTVEVPVRGVTVRTIGGYFTR